MEFTADDKPYEDIIFTPEHEIDHAWIAAVQLRGLLEDINKREGGLDYAIKTLSVVISEIDEASVTKN